MFCIPEQLLRQDATALKATHECSFAVDRLASSIVDEVVLCIGVQISKMVEMGDVI